MCRETRIPRDMCAGNTHPWETHITVTPGIEPFADLDRHTKCNLAMPDDLVN